MSTGRFAPNSIVPDTSNANASLTYGGQIAYLYRGYIGGEFLADFAPTVKFSSIVLAEHPETRSYMGNVIAAWPMGPDRRFVPYGSAGVGWIAMHTTIFTSPLINSDTEAGSSDRLGADFGGGFMGFAGSWGFRADVRWFKTSTTNEVSNVNVTSSPDDLTRAFLSGLQYWRGSVGVAFRW